MSRKKQASVISQHSRFAKITFQTNLYRFQPGGGLFLFYSFGAFFSNHLEPKDSSIIFPHLSSFTTTNKVKLQIRFYPTA